MRWTHVVVGLALTLAGAAGCKQQCFIHEADYNHYQRDLGLPENLENDANAQYTPTKLAMNAPSTVMDPERPIRPLTLAEAFSAALENGNVGSAAVGNNGFGTDNLVSFAGRGVAGSDSIRVLALDPAIAGLDIEASLAKFDAQFVTSMNWNVIDQPTQGLSSFQTGTNAAFSSSMLKPLPTGGVAGITFSTNFQQLANPPSLGGGLRVLNPSYTPRLQFQFEQPLLQGYGIEINEIRATHPGSILTALNTGGRVEGILLTRIRYDQTRAEFERLVNFMLLNVESAYWNLYGSYWTLYSREQALRQAFEAWKINKYRFEAGRIPVQDFAQTRQQYESFRSQRMAALAQVLENERQLRKLMGFPGEDGNRLVPVDPPTLTPYQPDWNTSVNEALALRPELTLARQDLKSRQLDIISARNLLLPDLRFTSTYGLTGLGSRLDGDSLNNAYKSLASNQFNEWSLGLRLNVPIGFRDAHAQVRAARLNLARSYNVLKDQEIKAEQYLEQQYRRLFEFHAQIEIQRSQREAAATQLEARFKEFLAGRGTLDILLEAQRVWADALRNEYDFIVQYNNTLAAFEFAKGTLLQHNNVYIAEGALPRFAQIRAVEHERQRSKALLLREREIPGVTTACDFEKGQIGIPALPGNIAPSAVPVAENMGKVPVIVEKNTADMNYLRAGKMPQPPSNVVEGILLTPTASLPGNGGDLGPQAGKAEAPRMLPPSMPEPKPAQAPTAQAIFGGKP